MQQPWNDCHLEVKSIYSPVEVAIRWCSLSQHEPQILTQMGKDTALPQFYPEWPCLRQRAEQILDAMGANEIPIWKDGSVVYDYRVAIHTCSVRHNDLKAWMSQHHPGQKPAFLFDETERQTHTAINADSFRTLQVDRDALRKELGIAAEFCKALTVEKETIEAERDSLKATVENTRAPGERAETTYLNIIGAMVDLMLNKSSRGQPYSAFTSQAAIISALLAHHDGKSGISTRTLEVKFAAARRELSAN